MDVDEATRHLRPQTAENLRKLAIWAAGEAERSTFGRTRVSAARVAQKFAEEAERLSFQQSCEEQLPEVLARRVR